jgi:hypothetical protein
VILIASRVKIRVAGGSQLVLEKSFQAGFLDCYSGNPIFRNIAENRGSPRRFL